MGTTAKENKRAPAYLRFGDVTGSELHDLSVRLNKLAMDLNRIADEVGDSTLRVDGVTKGDRGFDLLKAYTDNTKHAFNKSKQL